MARPREFDPEEAIADAMNVFWAQGYDGASLSDLLDGMGITRGSLYKAFTDKKSLFLRVMTAYEEQAVVPAVTVLTDDTIASGFDRVEKVFDTVTQAARAGDQRGCLLCTAAANAAADDADIARLVHNQLAQMRAGFAAAMDATDHANAAAFADLLLSQYVGMRIMVRAQVPLAQLDACKTALITTMRSGVQTD